MKYTYIILTLLALVLVASPARASYINLGVAGEYNAFILGDFTGNSSDTQGNLAVGGNARVSNYSIGGSVVVGNDFTMNNGSIGGDALIGGSSRLNGVGTDPYTVTNNATLPFDFDAQAAYLKNLSLSLGLLASNGTVDSPPWGVITLSGDNASAFQVFNINGSDLLNANTLHLNNIADGATILINVYGDVSGFENMGMDDLSAYSNNILFNFYEADDLILSSVGVKGSILAPYADVRGSRNLTRGGGGGGGWGQIDGTLIAGSYDAHIEQHDVPFDGGDTPVPEPGTFLIMGLGLLGLAVFLRRGKQRNNA
ncbi:choice-of-anchor A family protein [uncultured Pseudodesulfovibrio sp.]|uniref:choice-of-anchor A family protein n=1 Tax=uncultured Pseudodesulfovibrio sp. TaxID=2035858 RepID=UPI0029C6B0D2|nr:choice-of-anchor A family protein [uncultured Pseudodesulfovibrio sp.]